MCDSASVAFPDGGGNDGETKREGVPVMAMTNRERILAVLGRKSPDRVPWIARLDLWYHARMI